MPDNEQVLFGAEFDSEGVVKGVDETIKKLLELQDTQEALKQETKDYSDSIKRNEADLATARAKMEDLKKTNNDIAKAYKDLTLQARNFHAEGNSVKVVEIKEKMKGLQNQLVQNDKAYQDLKKSTVGHEAAIKTLTTNINAHKESLFTLTRQIHDTKKAQSEAESINLEARRSLERLTSVQYLAGEAANHFRREIVTTGLEFVTGFAGGIFAAAIPALIAFVEELGKTEGSLKNFENAANIAAIFKGAREKTGEDLVRLEAIRLKLNDTSISMAERIRLANEYNKRADEGNKIDATQIDNLTGVNKKIEDQVSLIKQRALTQAAINKIDEEANKLISNEVKLQEELAKRGFKSLTDYQEKQKQVLADQVNRFKSDPTKALLDQQGKAYENIKKGLDGVVNPSHEAARGFDMGNRAFQGLIDQVRKGRVDLDSLVNRLSGFITIEGLTTEKKDKKAPENVFQEKLAELKAKLAAASVTEFQSDTLIEKKFSEQLDKEFTDISKLLRDKKLTGPQSDILKGLLKQINDVELTKALDDFHKKQRDAMKAVNDAILEAQVEDGKKRAENIRNEFVRGQAVIAQNYETTVAELGKKLGTLIIKIDDDVKKGLLTADQATTKKALLTSIFGDLIDQAGVARTNAQLELSFKAFQRTIANLKSTMETDLAGLSETTTEQIKIEATQYLTGAITYEHYQKRLTKTLQEEANARRKIQIQELEDELRRVNARLASTVDPTIGKQLQEQQTKIRESLSALNREDASQSAQQDEEETKKKFDNILKYVNAVKEVTDAVLNFWNEVNKAEAAQLERSISLQEKRVENARLIADRGNAEYLKQEQKRMDELTLKQQENARKQLAINNALTLSQATVAAITAIAQAVETGDPFAGIAAVAAVIGAIAAAYSFVNSLQPVEAQFYEGVERLDGAGRPLGRDMIPARLHVGERVVKAEDNDKYWDALHAIHNHQIPPEVINEFVANYPNNNMPSIDFSRLQDATEAGLGRDSLDIPRHIEKLNNTMEKVVEAVGALGVNVNMDEYGFSLSLLQAQKKLKVRNRS
jgi:hypothetical protein